VPEALCPLPRTPPPAVYALQTAPAIAERLANPHLEEPVLHVKRHLDDTLHEVLEQAPPVHPRFMLPKLIDEMYSHPPPHRLPRPPAQVLKPVLHYAIAPDRDLSGSPGGLPVGDFAAGHVQ
jgi:hypothetical protein